jgi:hypothetical protein
VSIKIKVRATSETVVGDAEIQHQRYRTRRVRKVGSQLNIPKMPTPALSYVSRFHCMCCEEEVSNLVNCPVVCLLGTRMSGTSTEVVTQRVTWNFLQPQTASGFSAMTGIWAPMVMAKKCIFL